MLDNIRIVMVHTSHSGNIGAAARAMKNMCLSQLYLVSPANFPSTEASLRASHAADIVNSAVVTSSLEEAIADCELVIGTSARERTLKWIVENPRQMATAAVDKAIQAPVAIVFGRERTGLTNEELALCHRLVHIPTNAEYSSLNVASAVQVIVYELLNASLEKAEGTSIETENVAEAEDKGATAGQLQSYHDHLHRVMTEVEFFGSNNPENVMRRLQMFLNRSQPTVRELNILHGILTATQRKIK